MKGVATAACLCAVAGTVAIVVASAATGTGYGYVSEAGVPGAPLAGLYRAGVFAVAASLALLAAALKVHLGIDLAGLRRGAGAGVREAPANEAGRAFLDKEPPGLTNGSHPVLAEENRPGPADETGPALADEAGRGVLRVAADPAQGARWQRALAQACSRRAAHTGRRLDLDRLAGTIAVLSLAVAAPLAATSGAVPCTNGCPLPPYERASHQDIAHAVASIGGFGLAAVAMIVLALPSVALLTPPAGTASPASTTAAMPGPLGTATAGRLRTASRWGAGLAVPLLAAAGLAMLIVGRGLLAGTLERAALVTSLGWLVAAAATLATTRPSPAGSAGAAMRRRT